MSENATHSAIVAEMRRGTRLPGYWRSCDVNEMLQYHADRLEAAHERELAEKDAEIARLRREIELCRGAGAASKVRDLIEEMHRINRICSETNEYNWKEKIREISYKASCY